eukprot:3941921-Rhodomonas_salina.2
MAAHTHTVAAYAVSIPHRTKHTVAAYAMPIPHRTKHTVAAYAMPGSLRKDTRTDKRKGPKLLKFFRVCVCV